jgi:hypothetical protein
MTDSAQFTVVESKITFKLEGMISRGRNVSAYLNRVLMQKFKNAQQERFQTSNASQQGVWEPLNPTYLKRRMKKWPGSGDAILVRTGKLARGAQALDPSYFYKVVNDDQFIVGINRSAVPYSIYPGRRRPFMSFTAQTLNDWHDGIKNYVFRGEAA